MSWSLFLNKRGGGGGGLVNKRGGGGGGLVNKRGGGGGGLVNKRGGKSAESELFGTQVARVPEAEYAHA